MRGIVIAAACLAGLTASAQAQGWPQECKLTQVASLPMTLQGGHILIPISVNGVERSFILDTGGYASGLSAKTVTDLKLDTYSVSGVIIKDVGGKSVGKYVRSETLGFGNTQGKGLPLLVMDDLGAADGLLAPDLLRNFDVELDFAAAKVNLFHHHPCEGRALYWTSAFVVMPFEIVGKTHIRVPVTLDGKETMAIVDTGAPATVISLGSASALFDLSLASPGMEKLGHMVGGSGGTAETYTYPFKSLTLGGIAVANPNIRVADTANFVGTDNAKLLLGLSILRHLHLYIAYREGKIYASDANAG